MPPVAAARPGARPSSRRQAIIGHLRAHGLARIADMARTLDVSDETIRRDVKPLVESGALVKHHGTVSLSAMWPEAPFERRMRTNKAEKARIARHVAGLIADGDSIMLDTGTTTSLLARELLGKSDLTIVTNSSDIARTLATVNGNTVHMAGGALHGDNGAAFGHSAIEFVSGFHVRHAIISISAVNAQTGLMDHRLAEAEFARTVLRCGRRSMVITDHTKFAATALVRVCGFGGFDLLVTDREPPAEIVGQLRENSTELQVAGEAGPG